MTTVVKGSAKYLEMLINVKLIKINTMSSNYFRNLSLREKLKYLRIKSNKRKIKIHVLEI